MKVTNLYLILLVVFCCFSCKQRPAKELPFTTEPILETNQEIEEIPAFVKLSPEAQKEVDNWSLFVEMSQSFKGLVDLKKTEELTLKVDEILEKEAAVSKGAFPKKFNSPRIKSRLLVFKTYLLETQALFIETNVSDSQVKKQKVVLVKAFNGLVSQLSVILAPTIDESLLEEK